MLAALFIRYGWNAELWLPLGFGAGSILVAVLASRRGGDNEVVTDIRRIARLA